MLEFGGFHSHGATPKNGWFIVGKPNLKWMMTGDTPISGNLYSVGWVGWGLIWYKNKKV